MGDRPQKPSRQDLDTVTHNFRALYTRETPSPPGETLPAMVAPFDIDNSVPDNQEIQSVVKRLQLHKSPGPTGLTSNELRDWLEAAT